MLTVTTMGVIVLGMKCGVAIFSTVGVASGFNWFNKKIFSTKKGGSLHHEGDSNNERFNRRDI
ncbi:hypothetical protein JCM16418A_14920 [Paenibacillus pini]